jgi:AsmA protein
MRGLRVAGIVVAVLVALPLLALALAWLLLDPNEHKDRLQAAFRDATGRELQLEGPLSVSIVPWLAVESGRAFVSNREGFGEQPFVSFERARLGVRLWPLLTARRLEFGPVRLDGLALNLLVAKDGRNNWSDVLDRLEQRSPATSDASTPDPGRHVRVASVELRDASVSFTDAQAATRYAATQWQLETGPLERGTAVDLDTSLRVTRNDGALGRVSLHTRLDLAQPGRVVLAETAGKLLVTTERGRGDIEVGLRVPRLEIDKASRDISVREFEARLGEAVLTGHLGIVQGDAGPRIEGALRLARTDPRRLLGHLGIEAPRTRDAQALRRLAANSKVAYTAARGLSFEALALELDDSRFDGRAALRPGERLAVRFDLRGTELDADRYLPPPDAGPERSPGTDDPKARTKGSNGGVDLGGSVTLARLVVAKVPLQDARMNVRVRDGRLELEPLQARAFGGSLVTHLRYDYAAPEPTLSVRQELAGVDVAALLGQLFDARQLEGRGSGSFSLTSRGADGASLFANLRGPFDVEVTNGAVLGVDLWHELERAVAAAQLEASAATRSGSGRTPFERLSARGTLVERSLRTDRVEFVADFARVRGRGEVDYGRNALDLDLTARLLKAPKGRLLGVKVSRVKDADIPLDVTGTLAEPKVRPDVSKLLEAAAKDAIKEPLEGKLRDELEKIFKF